MTAFGARPVALALLVLVAGALVGVLGRGNAPSSSAATPAALVAPPTAPVPPDAGLGPEDGVVPDGVTAFDAEHATVARLDAALLDALRRATVAAAEDGVTIVVNSGWRSPAYQEHLLEESVSTYGSFEEAARWVATAETSAHVTGDAVDVGGVDARSWLAEHGDRFGLCRIYANEPWHHELRPDAVDDGCPRRYADPTQDPRMRR